MKFWLYLCNFPWKFPWKIPEKSEDKIELRFCNNYCPIMIFCAWNRKRSNMTHCCYIFSVRLKLIKTCFDLLKSAKTRLGLFQINHQNTKWKSKLGLHRNYFFFSFTKGKSLNNFKIKNRWRWLKEEMLPIWKHPQKCVKWLKFSIQSS